MLRHRAVSLLLAIRLASMSLDAHAVGTNVSLALTNDYVWRGTTQSQDDPAVQAGVKASFANGFYASVWGSNVEFASATHASSEFDFTLGWGRPLSENWALDLNVLHYRYPATTVDLNWTELNGTLTWRSNTWLSLGWSNQALGAGASATYMAVGAKFPLNDRLRFEAGAGCYALDDLDADGDDDDYLHGLLSAVWTISTPWELRVTAHMTDSAAEAFFGDEFAGDRLEAALQATF